MAAALHLVEALAVERDRALRDHAVVDVEQAGDRPQRGGLAGPVGAEQGDDLAVGHDQREAAQHQDHLVVDDLEVGDLQHRAALPVDRL